MKKLYKVTAPRDLLLFEPSTFYRSKDYTHSSTKPKDGLIKDCLLYAGEFEDVSLHLFPDIDRLRVFLQQDKLESVSELQLKIESNCRNHIFAKESDLEIIHSFRPTVYTFDAVSFTQVESNEYVSRQPVKALGCQTYKMDEVLKLWSIQIVPVSSIDKTTKLLQNNKIDYCRQC